MVAGRGQGDYQLALDDFGCVASRQTRDPHPNDGALVLQSITTVVNSNYIFFHCSRAQSAATTSQTINKKAEVGKVENVR